MKPTLKELIYNLEQKFGKLNSAAEDCAEDFHENYNDYIKAINSSEIIIITSPNMLADKLKEFKYTKYRIFSGWSILLTLAGLITIFFKLKIGLLLFAIAFILKLISNNLKTSISQKFSKDITNKILSNPNEGILDVCEYYILGILQLSSSKGDAHLPLVPSYSLNGIKKFTKTN
jgi:hypothetical protein